MGNQVFTGAVLILLVVFFIAIGPLLVMWSLNQLFPSLEIAYTFWNWLATLILAGAVRSSYTTQG